jgi:hypothetical protein
MATVVSTILVLHDVEIRRRSNSTGNQWLSRDIGRLTVSTMPSNPQSLHLRSDWEGERVPKIVLNAELSKNLPKPVGNAEDRRKIHLVLIDNSSWQKMGPRQFVLFFKTHQDASTFLTTIEFCFHDDVKKNKVQLKKVGVEEEEYEHFTQLWPESPIMFDAPSESDGSIESPLCEVKYKDMTLDDLIVECRKMNIKADKRFAKQTLINKLVR